MQTSDSRKRAAEGVGAMVQVPAELVEALREALDHWHRSGESWKVTGAARFLVDAAEPKCEKCGTGTLSTSGGRSPLKCIRASCNHIVGTPLDAAPTVPRIARSIDDLRAGMVVAVDFKPWVTGTVKTLGKTFVVATEDELHIHRDHVTQGLVVILSEPPAPTLPTTPGSVIEATRAEVEEPQLWFKVRSPHLWINQHGTMIAEGRLTLVRVLFDAGADA